VAVRTNERFVGDLPVKTERDLFLFRIGIEVAVFSQYDFF
jgi:hypothetical protein